MCYKMINDLNDVLVMLSSIPELLIICHSLVAFSFPESLSATPSCPPPTLPSACGNYLFFCC